MKHLLFLFLDGVGLGKDDPKTNPFAAAKMPALKRLLGGQGLVLENTPLETKYATLLALDANLGIAGLPQSATGQATLLRGKNVPAQIGNHYGPKPNRAVEDILSEDNLFKQLRQFNLQVSFLNAFPQSYFEAIGSGRRIYGAIAMAAVRAGIPLRTIDDLKTGNALSADFTGEGLRERLNLLDVPVISPLEAGKRLATLALEVNFSLFEYWLTDYAGHSQNFPASLDLLETFDLVLGSLLKNWKPDQGLVVLTSDHGNLEDLGTRRHTDNPVPCLILGDLALRRPFAAKLNDLTDITPAILQFFSD